MREEKTFSPEISIKSVITSNFKEIKLNSGMSFVNKAISITKILNNLQDSVSGKDVEIYDAYYLCELLNLIGRTSKEHLTFSGQGGTLHIGIANVCRIVL